MAEAFSVHEFESREVIARRLKAGQRISAQELLYPLMQGYDSVAIQADVELGGTDQRYNLLAGRRIQPLYKQEPQDILMTELLEGTDGRKMSSSWGNVINITDEPKEMFGKAMSLKDELTERYLWLATRLSQEEINKVISSHPKEAKMKLAYEMVKLYHGESEAQKAQKNFSDAFSKGGVPDEILTVKIKKNTPLVEILLEKGLVSSKTEFNRLQKDGAIKEIDIGVYRIGKHRFIKVERE
jgi:tyrosyl-tRNA synthetase